MSEARAGWHPESREAFVSPKPETAISAEVELSIERANFYSALGNYIDDLKHWLDNPGTIKPDQRSAELSQALGKYLRAPGVKFRSLLEVDELIEALQNRVTEVMTRPVTLERQGWAESEAEMKAAEEAEVIRIGAIGECVMERAIEMGGYHIYYSGGHNETQDVDFGDHEDRHGIDFWVEIPQGTAEPLVLAVQMKTVPIAPSSLERFADTVERATEEDYPYDTVLLHPVSNDPDIEEIIGAYVDESEYDVRGSKTTSAMRSAHVYQRQAKVRSSLSRLISVQAINNNVVPVFAWLPSSNGERERGWYDKQANLSSRLVRQVMFDLRRIIAQRHKWLQRSAEYDSLSSTDLEVSHA